MRGEFTEIYAVQARHGKYRGEENGSPRDSHNGSVCSTSSVGSHNSDLSLYVRAGDRFLFYLTKPMPWCL